MPAVRIELFPHGAYLSGAPTGPAELSAFFRYVTCPCPALKRGIERHMKSSLVWSGLVPVAVTVARKKKPRWVLQPSRDMPCSSFLRAIYDLYTEYLQYSTVLGQIMYIHAYNTYSVLAVNNLLRSVVNAHVLALRPRTTDDGGHWGLLRRRIPD